MKRNELETNELRESIIDVIEGKTGCRGVWHEWKTAELCKLLIGADIIMPLNLVFPVFDYIEENEIVL